MSRTIIEREDGQMKIKYTDHKHCDEACEHCNPETMICEKHKVSIESYQICIEEGNE